MELNEKKWKRILPKWERILRSIRKKIKEISFVLIIEYSSSGKKKFPRTATVPVRMDEIVNDLKCLVQIQFQMFSILITWLNDDAIVSMLKVTYFKQ